MNRRVVGVLSSVLIAVIVAALSACSGKEVTSMKTSSVVPAATGNVQYWRTDTNNTKVRVGVEHLAEPGKVRSGATSYVLWVTPSGASPTPQNMGALKLGSDLEGDIETFVPYKTFDVFVTAELSEAVTSPTGERVLESKVSVE